LWNESPPLSGEASWSTVDDAADDLWIDVDGATEGNWRDA